MKESVLKEIFESAHAVVINMNDTFYYACADSACIDTTDLEDLAPMIEKYGWKAFVAYEAIRRGHDPMIPQVKDDNFKNAKKDILETMEKAGEFYELRETLKHESVLEARERKKLSKKISTLREWFSFFPYR